MPIDKAEREWRALDAWTPEQWMARFPIINGIYINECGLGDPFPDRQEREQLEHEVTVLSRPLADYEESNVSVLGHAYREVQTRLESARAQEEAAILHFRIAALAFAHADLEYNKEVRAKYD